MIPGNELSRWLRDGGAQDAQAAHHLDAAKHLKTLRLFSQLREDLDRVASDCPSAVLACARRAMMDDLGLEEVFSFLVAEAAADPFFRPLMRSVATELHSGILLFDTGELTLFASIIPAEALAAKRMNRDGRRSIVFTGQHSLHRFIRSGGATLSLWEAPPIEAAFTARASGRCRLVERRRIADGELIELDGGRESFVIDHAITDLVYLQAVASAGRAPLAVEYDSDTFGFAGASSTDEVSSRTQMMLALLRTMDRQDAVPLMLGMLEDPNFYARWQAMRELLALDADAALPHLRILAQCDPHPDVRAAAAATLDACFAGPEPATAPELVMEMN